jgi:hypothetical protein
MITLKVTRNILKGLKGNHLVDKMTISYLITLVPSPAALDIAQEMAQVL